MYIRYLLGILYYFKFYLICVSKNNNITSGNYFELKVRMRNGNDMIQNNNKNLKFHTVGIFVQYSKWM